MAQSINSIDGDGSCGLAGPGDLPGVDPLLGPLANNGGPTDTRALLAGSPAIDAGDNATCEPTDQRGVARPQGPACDIGAYELVPPTPEGLLEDLIAFVEGLGLPSLVEALLVNPLERAAFFLDRDRPDLAALSIQDFILRVRLLRGSARQRYSNDRPTVRLLEVLTLTG